MIKKISIYLVCISLLFSSLIFTASADSVSSGTSDPYIIDLLTDDFYYFNGHNSSGNFVTGIKYYTPFASVNGGSAEFWWSNSSADDDVEFVTFTIQADERPTEVSFRRWNGGTNGLVTATYKASSGNLHLYTATISRSQIAQCGIKAEWGFPYTGMFGVRSVRGFTDISHDVSTSSYRFAHDYYFTGDLIRNETSSSGSSASLPFHGSQIFYDDYDRRLISGTMYIFISDVQRVLRDIDKLTTFFWCYDADPEISVSVTNYSGSVLHVADFTLDQALSRTTTGSIENPIYCYQLNADFSSYYVGNNQITISIKTDSVPYSVSGDYQVYTFVESIFVYPPVDDLPWYKVFFNWCSGVWQSLCDSVIDAFNSIFGDVDFSQSFNNMTDGTPDMQGQADSFSSTASDVNQSFVTKLDEVQDVQAQIQPVSMDWNGFKSQFDGLVANGSPIMTMIVDQHMVTLILEIVFIISLVAYILFGKRG